MDRKYVGAPAGPLGGRRRTLGALALLLAGLGVVVACSSSGGSSSSSPGPSSFSPNPSAFSSGASALGSLASSAKASVSSAAASLSAAASSFAASVSAQAGENRAGAQSALATVTGSGNVTSGITITGLPKATTGGLNAALVTIVNNTSGTANYAIRVNFSDASGTVVDSTVVNRQNVAAGATATVTAFSTQSPDQALVPTVAQAQSY
ncbi:FxLYD domain-containing protein [Kitasatospora sp. NPDC094015]|uniref:FxLYD domain-containing protein n=1 Tax=Kitasatospora sp. NPDC094015 TaxID=3155205 RepID=UPI00331FE143